MIFITWFHFLLYKISSLRRFVRKSIFLFLTCKHLFIIYIYKLFICSNIWRNWIKLFVFNDQQGVRSWSELRLHISHLGQYSPRRHLPMVKNTKQRLIILFFTIHEYLLKNISNSNLKFAITLFNYLYIVKKSNWSNLTQCYSL